MWSKSFADVGDCKDAVNAEDTAPFFLDSPRSSVCDRMMPFLARSCYAWYNQSKLSLANYLSIKTDVKPTQRK
jgi:hypothetical protein